jgi:hypothetical protein
MAAAPDLFVDEPRLVSPELALVDATLAAELRVDLRGHEDPSLSTRSIFSEVLATADPPEELVEAVFNDGVAGSRRHDGREYERDSVPQVLDQGVTAESVSNRSSYPVLPAPLSEDATEATEAALLRMRERFELEL